MIARTGTTTISLTGFSQFDWEHRVLAQNRLVPISSHGAGFNYLRDRDDGPTQGYPSSCHQLLLFRFQYGTTTILEAVVTPASHL